MRTRTLGWGLVVLVALLVSAGCGGSSGKAGTATTTTAATTTTTLPVMPADFNWWTPAVTALGQGWTVGPCTNRPAPETKGKALCLDNKDGRRAVVEHFRFAVVPGQTLNEHAAQFVVDFLKDRKAGCGAGYRLAAEPIVALDVKDGPVKRYGFKGGTGGAPDSERTIQWAGIRGPALILVTISAYDPGSCLPNTGQATMGALDEILPGLDALVVAAGLPPLKPT